MPTTCSVTGLAHEYQSPFDAKNVIRGMKMGASQAWPRVEYAVDARPATVEELEVTRGALLCCGGKTVSVVHANTLERAARGADVKRVLDAGRRRTPGSEETDEAELFTFERAKTDEEIIAAWNANGREASHRGTEAHYMCELFLNGLPCRWWEPEMAPLFSFLREHALPRGIVAHSTEKEIVCVDADVGGSIDAILYDEGAGVYHILDFKRSDKLAHDLVSPYRKKMQSPMSHLDDCRGAAYCLQLSIYQYILERDYGFSIGDRILLSVHPDAPFLTSVPYLRDETEYIMERRFALVTARRRVRDEVDPVAFTCALTGAPAVDAVRLADGRIAMEKAAVVHGDSFTPDVDVRHAFEAHVRELIAHVPAPKASQCIAWRRRMCAEGLAPFV